MRKQKIKFIIFYSIYILFILFFIFSNISFAGLFDSEPELVSKLNDALEDIEGWLLTLATPAAAVAVGGWGFL